MEEVTYKRTMTVGAKEIEIYIIKDYRMRRPEFPNALYGVEIVVNDEQFLGGWYEDDSQTIAAVRGIMSVLAMFQTLAGQDQDLDVSYFIRTWIAPKNELNGHWNPLPHLDE